MESFKKYRHNSNPKEKEFHDKFLENNFHTQDLDFIIFGHNENLIPIDYLTERERRIVLSTIQWLGSPVGKNFLNECGFFEKVINEKN